MSAQLSLPGVKWPPQPRPPPRSPEKRLPRPIAPILGSPPAIKQQRGMRGRAREFVREIWKSATLNAAELYVVSCDVLFFQAPSLSPPCSFCSRIQIIAVIFVEALYEIFLPFRAGMGRSSIQGIAGGNFCKIWRGALAGWLRPSLGPAPTPVGISRQHGSIGLNNPTRSSHQSTNSFGATQS